MYLTNLLRQMCLCRMRTFCFSRFFQCPVQLRGPLAFGANPHEPKSSRRNLLIPFINNKLKTKNSKSLNKHKVTTKPHQFTPRCTYNAQEYVDLTDSNFIEHFSIFHCFIPPPSYNDKKKQILHHTDSFQCVDHLLSPPL